MKNKQKGDMQESKKATSGTKSIIKYGFHSQVRDHCQVKIQNQVKIKKVTKESLNKVKLGI